jgi:rhodanese-related sulfurtransferase
MMRRALALAAVVAGALAAFAGSPFASHNARINIASLTNAIANEEDHVTAVDLAKWIRERKAGLRIIDVRSAAECNGYHLPGEELVPLEALVHSRFEVGQTIVLVSENGGHAAQAWVFLRALGHQNVYFLRGGVQEWLDQVLNPVNPTREVAALSRYFGGEPGVAIPGAAPHIDVKKALAARRGGC